jgi:hypothetical protein
MVYLGDCLAVLPQLEASSIDALVTDPPAALAFMNRKWDTFGGRAHFIEWLTERMSEAFRVMKPGAHGLVWAIPRTSHWTGMALEDAGFEVRDFVAHHFGSGFPKSLDVSKAIDKASGQSGNPVSGNSAMSGPNYHRTDKGNPITEAARQWEGWGTALKPATEIWWLVRKPLAQPNVAAQMLATGTGALNIDGCRVGVEDRFNPAAANKPGGASLHMSVRGMPDADGRSAAGRWPANLVLSHADGCRPAGMQKVRGSLIAKPSHHEFNSGYSGKLGGPRPSRGHGDPDGTETVEAWECTEGCPVAELDRQSGLVRSAGLYDKGSRGIGDKEGPASIPIDGLLSATYADSGGASRFFYTAKASSSDRNAGLFDQRKGRNVHPTVKPTDLMRYLCRLITPPGGLILDPFCGSGSTLVGARLEGFRAIGIDQDAESVEIARRRVAWANHQIGLFEPLV